MTIPPYARLAARLLKHEHEAPGQPQPPPAAVRADAVSAIERALVQRARKRTLLQRAAYGGSFAAAAAALLWVVPASHPQPTSVARGAVATPLSAQTQDIFVHPFGDGARVYGAMATGALQAGARVRAMPHGRALLAFSTGTRVTLEGDSDLTLVENGAAQVLALDHGALRADVAKLAPGRRFLVHTADAEVEVHGTSFRVSTHEDSAHCAGVVLTQVDVFEGVVTARTAGVEHRIEKGGQWAAACPEAQAAPAPVQPKLSAPANEAGSSDVRTRGVRAELPAVPDETSLASRSDLIAQNDAFAAAVAANRAGELARAVRGFDDLLARYPHGPLTESATVQRLKVVRKLDPERARSLSREYLARYPDGFARELAAEIVAESP